MLKLLGPYRWLIAAGVVLALLTAIYSKGHHDGKASELRAEASRLQAAKAKVARKEVKAAAITEKVATQLQAERVRIEYRTRTIVQEIQHEAPRIDAGCVVPPEFVRLYNSAANPGVSTSSSGSERPAP